MPKITASLIIVLNEHFSFAEKSFCVVKVPKTTPKTAKRTLPLVEKKSLFFSRVWECRLIWHTISRTDVL